MLRKVIWFFVPENKERNISELENKYIENLYKEWGKCLDVQMHFYELQMKFRTFWFTIIFSIIWFISNSFSKEISLFVYPNVNHKIAINTILIFWLPFSLLFIFFLLDWLYYRKLLLASIDFVQNKFDSIIHYKILNKKIPIFWLTTFISEKSSNLIFSVFIDLVYLIPIIIYILLLYFYIKTVY